MPRLPLPLIAIAGALLTVGSAHQASAASFSSFSFSTNSTASRASAAHDSAATPHGDDSGEYVCKP